MTVISYTPQKNYPSFSEQTNEVVTLVTYATAGNQAYLASDVLGGFILRNTVSAARTDTLPSAQSLIQAIQGAQVGSAIEVTIRNTSPAAGTLTVNAGQGGSYQSGADTQTIAYLNQKTFLIIVTSLGDQNNNGATYSILSMGTVVF